MSYLSALDFWGAEQSPLVEALLESVLGESAPNTSPGGSVGRDDTTGGYSRGTQFQPGRLQPGQQQQPLGPGWLNNPYQATSDQADSHFNKMAAANAVQNPLVRALLGAVSPIPGTSTAANMMANYWLNNNVADGSTAQALGLGYVDEEPEIDPQSFYTVADQSDRATGNAQFSRGQMYGNGSRMNPTSAFIYAMPGFSNVRTEPLRINERIKTPKGN